jgi:hypothetical protein
MAEHRAEINRITRENEAEQSAEAARQSEPAPLSFFCWALAAADSALAADLAG